MKAIKVMRKMQKPWSLLPKESFTSCITCQAHVTQEQLGCFDSGSGQISSDKGFHTICYWFICQPLICKKHLYKSTNIYVHDTARDPWTNGGKWIGFSWVMIINEWFVLVDGFSFGIKRFPDWDIKFVTGKLFLFIQKAHDAILCVTEVRIEIFI